MAGSLSQHTPYMNELLFSLKTDLITECEAAVIEEYEANRVEEYKRSGKQERDILWMKHRTLRKLFDEIEKA
jgi:hypothetical protein